MRYTNGLIALAAFLVALPWASAFGTMPHKKPKPAAATVPTVEPTPSPVPEAEEDATGIPDLSGIDDTETEGESTQCDPNNTPLAYMSGAYSEDHTAEQFCYDRIANNCKIGCYRPIENAEKCEQAADYFNGLWGKGYFQDEADRDSEPSCDTPECVSPFKYEADKQPKDCYFVNKGTKPFRFNPDGVSTSGEANVKKSKWIKYPCEYFCPESSIPTTCPEDATDDCCYSGGARERTPGCSTYSSSYDDCIANHCKWQVITT
jgi:hypothetical protein